MKMKENFTKQDIIKAFDERLSISQKLLSRNGYDAELVNTILEFETGMVFLMNQLGMLSEEEYWDLISLVNRKVRYINYGE